MAINWRKPQYGVAVWASIGPGLEIGVSYSMERLAAHEPKYQVSVFGRRQPNARSLEEGKRQATEIATRILLDALATLTTQNYASKG